MKKPDKNIQWAQEFKSFLDAQEMRPPERISRSIATAVHRDLHPRFPTIFAKLSLLHMVVGSLSLLICSQFGMGQGLNLAHVFMRWGDLVCTMACGSLFLGLTSLVAGWILSSAELRRIRQTGYSIHALLSLASLLVFFCFGAEIALSYALAWLGGALAAAIASTEFCLGIRSRQSY